MVPSVLKCRLPTAVVAAPNTASAAPNPYVAECGIRDGEVIGQARGGVDPSTQIVWPVYPHNPYANGPEKSPLHAVGRLTVPLRLKPQSEDWTVLPGEREIAFELEVD